MTVEQTVLTIEGRKTEKEEKLFLMLKSICRYQSSQAAQLWNQCRPLMFLWLPNANSGALERPSWQAVALCRRIRRRRV